MADSPLRRSWTASSLDGSMSTISMQDLPNLPGVRRDVSAINPKLYKQFKASRSALIGSPLDEDRQYFGGDDQSLHSYFDEASNFDMSRVTNPFPSAGSAYNDISGRYSLVSQQKDRLSKSRSLPYTQLATIPAFVRDSTGRVSIFVACFVEAATDVTEERSRKVEIKFFHEDNSIEIIEPKIENSGIMQGKFLKRHQIFKPVTRITPTSTQSSTHKKDQANHRKSLLYTLQDMTAGAELEIYNRTYIICDCDLNTKQYMAEVLQIPFGAPMALPSSLYDPKSRPGMSRSIQSRVAAMAAANKHISSGASTASSTASNYTSGGSRKKKSGFFEYDRKVLRFFGIWDSRDTLFGDVLRVKLHYTLADDLIEIIAVPDRNSGRDPLPTLLKKSVIMKRVPLQGDGFENNGLFRSTTPNSPSAEAGGGRSLSPSANVAYEERPYHWSDLHIGDTIAVASMQVQLIDADAFTRQFYQEKELPLEAPIELELPVYPTVKSEIPPYNGFGSEEDSLQTCKPSLIPTAPMKDGQKMNLFQGMILRFKATLNNPKEADKSREFIIQVHLEDDTFQIREPTQRNTGHKGGIFLSRCKLESHNGTKPLQPTDLHVGSTVTILSHMFDVHDCDQYTFKYMEDNARLFPFSDIALVNVKLRAKKAVLQKVILTMPGLTATMVDVDELYALLTGRCNLDVVKQEVCTLFRTVDAHREGTVKLTKLLKYMMDL